jgi:hypothetical protein
LKVEYVGEDRKTREKGQVFIQISTCLQRRVGS